MRARLDLRGLPKCCDRRLTTFVDDELGHILGRSEIGHEGQWVWQASRLHFTPASERFFMSMIRKCDPLLYLDGFERGLIHGRTRKLIDSGSGHERAYQFLTF